MFVFFVPIFIDQWRKNLARRGNVCNAALIYQSVAISFTTVKTMNCEECKGLLGLFMDSELEESQAAMVRMHLSECIECAAVCEDLVSILDVCTSGSPSEILPPDSKNLWLRINNVIESEIKPEVPTAHPRRRFWQLSFGQLAAALGFIAVMSSLATFAVIRSFTLPAGADYTSRSAATQTTFEKVLSRIGLIETLQQARERRLKEQQAAIEYWNARVQNRRLLWDRATREAFDRNLQVIDESVSEYTSILQKDPEDDLSGEMLDSVLNEKMNLLRDFSDL